MYKLSSTAQFKKDLRKAIKQGKDTSLMDEVVNLLVAGIPLPEKYKDHALTGNWMGHRECHVLSDWLLIYRKDEEVLVLTLTRTGSHSELFS